MALAYLRTLSVFGRSAKLDAQLPVSWARFEGVVSGEFRTRSPQGLNDPRVRLSVNVFGAPALDLPGFVKYRQRTIVGASFQVALPLGQYDRTRFINLGAHRWSFRPEIALSHTRGRWIFEASAGTWLFTDNDDYPGGSSLSQRPLYFAKGNAIYTFRRNLWASVSYGHAEGGQTALNDLIRQDLQKNDRMGATLAAARCQIQCAQGRLHDRARHAARRGFHLDWSRLSIQLGSERARPLGADLAFAWRPAAQGVDLTPRDVVSDRMHVADMDSSPHVVRGPDGQR